MKQDFSEVRARIVSLESAGMAVLKIAIALAIVAALASTPGLTAIFITCAFGITALADQTARPAPQLAPVRVAQRIQPCRK